VYVLYTISVYLTHISQPPPPNQVRELMRGLVSGVKYLHDSYIVHRDIKPQNVLLLRRANGDDDEKNDWAKHYVAKLSDMGLGKQLRQQRSSWRGGGTVGTAGWQAPEVLRAMIDEEDDLEDRKQKEEKSSSTNQFDRLGRAVDVWSMGCVLHTLACLGQHPFGKWYEREKRILERRFEAPVSDLAAIPELRALVRVVLRIHHHTPHQLIISTIQTDTKHDLVRSDSSTKL